MQKRQGETPLDLARKYHHTRLVQRLVKAWRPAGRVSASGRRLSPRRSFPLPFPTDVPKIAADVALFALS
jgi:hypothetical protein